MLTPPMGVRIYLALAPVDMRKGFDGMAAQVSRCCARIRSAVSCSCFARAVAIG